MDKKPSSSSPFLNLLFKLARSVLYFSFISIALVLVGGTALYYYFSSDLPKLTKIDDYHPMLVAEVFDDTEKKIGEFWSECRFLTQVKDIPDKMIKAFVASEDERFFEHHGVDFWGIFRAFINNLKAGHVVQGGSTITQQVTKSLVLSPERTYDRKIKEAILATQIEKNLSKDQILFLYLNHIFFGNRAYGVTAAARNYFHKDLKDLNIAEIAMIVGLSKAPSAANPLVNPEKAKARADYVIDRMEEQGYITKKEAEEAKNTPFKIYKAGTDRDFNLEYAPYFTEHIRRYILEKYGEEALYQGGWKIYATADLEMQKAAQKAVDKGLREVDKQRVGFKGPIQNLSDTTAIEKFNAQNHMKILDSTPNIDYGEYKNVKALMNIKTPLTFDKYYDAVIVDGSRGKGFEAMVGNVKGLILPETMNWGARSSSLKKGDVVQVKIYQPKVADSKKSKEKEETESQPALVETAQPLFALEQEPAIQGALYSYEPFTGAVRAIVGGLDYRKSEFNRATQALRQPGSSIKPLIYSSALDKGYTPNTIIMDAPIVYEESPGKFWTPKNYGGTFSGPTPLRSALVHSRNVVTVRMVMDIGTHYVAAYMRKLGLTSPIQKYYSMALGANDVYLAELARSYGTFATGGILPETFFIRKIVDPKGNIIEENKPMEKKFIITWDQAGGSAGTETKPAAPSEKKKEIKTPESLATNSSTESQPSGKETGSAIPWDEMAYNPLLIQEGEKVIEKDQLNLSEHEKKILYGDYIPPDHVISPQTAATMVSLLQDVVKYGTGTRVLPLGKPAAGKTGTTNNASDVWFIGFTPTLAAGVWVGYDEKAKTIGRGATGGHIAAPIWLSYMTEATKKYPTKDFILPSWLNLSKYQTPMEIVTGDTESIDYSGGIPGTGKEGGGAEFFSDDL